jgi:hypothetical protein
MKGQGPQAGNSGDWLPPIEQRQGIPRTGDSKKSWFSSHQYLQTFCKPCSILAFLYAQRINYSITGHY